MFHSVPRRPICEIGVNTMRLQSSRSLGCTVEEGMEKLQRFPMLGRNVGLLLSWLQRAGVGSNRASGQKKKKGLLSIFADHCGFVTGQRLRRACQVGELYSNLYSERTRWTLVGNIWRRFQNNHAPTGKLVAALAGVFLWDIEKIQDEEIRRCGLELEAMEAVKKLCTPSSSRAGHQEGGWEVVVDKKDIRVWKRQISDSQLYEYRVLGSYNDVTPRQFFNVQLDTEYRKKWDSLVIKLEVVDRDANTGSEVVHWATHFPYPLFSRDYVYVRRYDVDEENNMMVLVSRAVQHPRVPETQEFVRVHSYQSKMVIRPHKSFDENGFDYLLTYSDDPQTVFPRYCVSWMVSSGMPDFLEKLHTAALRAKNLEVGIHDYTGVIKSSESNRQPSQERLGAENTHTGGPGHIYA
ncbi:stAR-related lipid transfer protein 7, mitochondrial isoform X2 [Xiphophorus maculatus]|uniref:StAR-related lipid transfer protein 7, mitochondrial n=1 Tax=Xiphophorus maculatus TaxID=8083 RepID=A0A3B5QEY9_XIPMA|nr:stAR-related lipid transfer protein 7, mitochondrial isoform X2 [Xiphophorus maculatus]XP_027881583.1 stAR-related lipid transfer protein 7, mitochondrial isoform X2 [Xiphophorus couchianus]